MTYDFTDESGRRVSTRLTGSQARRLTRPSGVYFAKNTVPATSRLVFQIFCEKDSATWSMRAMNPCGSQSGPWVCLMISSQ
jgi:hypothetical protein